MAIETVLARKLSDDQLDSFDWNFVDDSKQKIIWGCIDQEFPTGEFSFIDIGGGNGSFTDLILDRYPKAHGVVVDNSDMLLAKNRSNPRKRVINKPAEQLQSNFEEKFDIVFLNFLLHHLVVESYVSTRSNQAGVLAIAKGLLTKNGRISIFENIYDGAFIHFLPSYLIFYLTSSKLLGKITRRLGANTGGVGVCFLSKRQWQSTFKKNKLKIGHYSDDRHFTLPIYQKIILHLGDVRYGHFWCKLD